MTPYANKQIHRNMQHANSFITKKIYLHHDNIVCLSKGKMPAVCINPQTDDGTTNAERPLSLTAVKYRARFIACMIRKLMFRKCCSVKLTECQTGLYY
mmetsp:Transcript_22920/g.50274  ORF Transcript_22920/g.50274 Transcript_22920/m.50274 type:complete len:98 (-) Transcript_22920:1625-1918(-)